MKNLLLVSAILFSVTRLSAQGDTLLFENFDVDPTANWPLFNSGNDTTWVNYDFDGLPDANNRPLLWFWNPNAFADVDSTDACLFSSSWLQTPQMLNRNYLITPPIQIADANAVLSWYSAPRQTPRYVDGYTVMVSTTDNIESSFTDTIFQAAQYLSGSGSDWSTYVFSNGWVHGLDGTYIQFDGDSGAYLGVLQPQSVSLAQFSGQTIYITFFHDSDDDNLIALDDILVTGTLVGVNEAPIENGLTIFPNPTSDKIELNYLLKYSSPVTADIYDIRGAKVLSVNRGMQIAGSQKLTIDVSKLAAGTYSVRLNIAGTEANSIFIKQ